MSTDLVCPTCDAPAAYQMGHEVPGVFDGVLYWTCLACGERRHRWPEGHRLHEATERVWSDRASA